jgi:Ca-activated chloride channel family protein
MRKFILSLLVVSLSFPLGTAVVHADGMLLPEALSPDYVVVRYHRVTVRIEDGHVVTRVEQEFHNPNLFPINGRYMFPVPPDAILSRFQATVDGVAQMVTRQDRLQTNATLYEMVVARRDPSLLQYADWESLALDLNLPAGGSRRMTLEYEEVLAPVGGLYRYRYVLSTERYSAQPLEEVSVKVEIRSSSGLSTLYSSSHPVTIERPGTGSAQVSWEARDFLPTEDFELFFAPAEGGFGGGLLTGERSERDHFLFLFAPAAEPLQGGALPKDIVFMVDRSGSMSGEKIEQAQSALRFILGQLNPEDRFSIVGFDDRLEVWSWELQPVTEQSLADARLFVDRLMADGNTDLEGALRASLEILSGPAAEGNPSRTVIFLTDGLPTAGVTDPELIAQSVAGLNARQEARLHVFGVGYDVNTHLLDRLAAENGGTVTYVQPGENLEAVLTGFYQRIARPVLTEVEIEFEGMAVSDLYPSALPDMFEGSSLLVAGRYLGAGDSAIVRVRGRAGAEEREYVYRFELGTAGSHDFVPRLWATRRVGELLDRVRVEGESEALVTEIRELGLAYGLVTPYTTFVIQAQTSGAASAANMALYADQAGLNAAGGQTTVQARVQNQHYQQADQAYLAGGANVVNSGQKSFAQLTSQNVDLSLLQEVDGDALNAPLTDEWIDQNIEVDRIIEFGSDAYFELAQDPAIRPMLQSGVNLVFAHDGEVIAVRASVEGSGRPLADWVRELWYRVVGSLWSWAREAFGG